ncbi:6-bladed beta-propeller [Belliella marina]|uniref:6-bladed beta-propeller n=1 Tax=Belliella marina TaxID=1644146 RepID=A0ABW4VLF7_9BACT
MKILIRSVLLISFVLLAIIVVASCGRSTDVIEQVYYDQEGFIVFDFNDHNTVAILYLSEFVKEIEYIPLETNSACLIGEIDKVLIDKNFIYVLDKRIANAAFVFDMEGRFIKQLGRKGEAEGEYMELGEMTLIGESQIMIYDHIRQLMVVFENLEYSYTQKIDWKSSNIQELDGYFYHNPFLAKYNDKGAGPYELFISNNESVIIESHFEYPSVRDVAYEKRNVFRFYDDSVLFIPPFYNKVFSIKGQKISPRYFLNFGDKQLPIEDTYSYEALSDALKNYGHMGDTFLENQQHVFFEASYLKPSSKYCLYNKKESVFKFSSKMINDVDSLVHFKFDNFNGDFAYGALSPVDLIAAITQKENLAKKKLDDSRLKMSETSDNPVIAVYHFVRPS